MPSRRTRSLRFLLPLVLAAVLAGEITGIALAHTIAAPAPAATAASATAASIAGTVGSAAATVPSEATGADAARDPLAALAGRTRSDLVAKAARPVALPAVARVAKTPLTGAAKSGTGHGAAGGSKAAYRGTNHVWIPSLGVSKGIQSFPCSRSRPPAAGVYRWGCAGTNNVYLLSHAWSTFEPLHDAYVSGRLRKGMKVIYADGGAHVHTYSVIWWRITAPTTAASWAWASLSRPGMTLQTCVGSQSQYRLMVRLTRVG